MDNNGDKVARINPSWVIQGLILALMAVAGYFIDDKLSGIADEIRLSRLERTQIRNDLSALEIGLRGDRFTRTEWLQERTRLEQEHREFQKRLDNFMDEMDGRH